MRRGGFQLIYALPMVRTFVLGERYVIRHPLAGTTSELEVTAISPMRHPSGRRVAIDLTPVLP